MFETTRNNSQLARVTVQSTRKYSQIARKHRTFLATPLRRLVACRIAQCGLLWPRGTSRGSPVWLAIVSTSLHGPAHASAGSTHGLRTTSMCPGHSAVRCDTHRTLRDMTRPQRLTVQAAHVAAAKCSDHASAMCPEHTSAIIRHSLLQLLVRLRLLVQP